MLLITFLVSACFCTGDASGVFDEKTSFLLNRIDCKNTSLNTLNSKDSIFICEENDTDFVARRSFLERGMTDGTLERAFHRGQQTFEWVKFKALLFNLERKYLSSRSPCASFDLNTRGEVSEISTSSVTGSLDFEIDLSIPKISKVATSGMLQVLGSMMTEHVCKGVNGETAELQMVQLYLILINVTLPDTAFKSEAREKFQRSMKIPLGGPIRRCVTDTRLLVCHQT